MGSSIPNSKNCFADKYPEIAKQWHFVKNGDLTPQGVTYASMRKVWWTCEKGHEWIASIKHRSNGSGCPYCYGRYATLETCLAINNPDLSREWNFAKNRELTPSTIMPNSGRKVWWICEKGHEWDASVAQRNSGHRGCPYCCNQKINLANCLATLNPKLASEWHPTKNGELTPYDVSSNSGKKYWWICSNNHEYMAKISNRNSLKSDCPYCSHHLSSKETCLLTKNPLVSRFWHPTKNGKLTSSVVAEFSHKKVWWLCANGHEYLARISDASRGDGCPYCNGVLLKDGELCASIPEAIKYLEYKQRKMVFEHNKIYSADFGNYRYDFYFPKENKYVEVTSYNRRRFKNKIGRYREYLRKIVKKRGFVENVLHAKFEFIQFTPTKEQIKMVRENMK